MSNALLEILVLCLQLLTNLGIARTICIRQHRDLALFTLTHKYLNKCVIGKTFSYMDVIAALPKTIQSHQSTDALRDA